MILLKENKKCDSSIGRTSIDPRTQNQLWGMAAGRCEICGKLLYCDSYVGQEGNYAELAHIHAVSENGPRHKYGMTPSEKNNISNLMLLCAEHHHMIDTNEEFFETGYLLNLKHEHEQWVRDITEISNKQTCRIVSYFSNIDVNEESFSDMILRNTVAKSKQYPRSLPIIKLAKYSNTKYSINKDEIQRQAAALENNCKDWFDEIQKTEDSIAIFSLAPQPLLIRLGTLINDQNNVIVYQCHRIGHKWAWPEEKKNDTVEYEINWTRTSDTNQIALVIDLSAKILDDRIIGVVGSDVNICHITIPDPNRNFVVNEKIQDDFVITFRKAMEDIKNLRPAPKYIHLFPVMPNSLAVKLGMDYMPKTDLPIHIYEQANQQEGFFEALTIGGQV